MTVKRIPAEDLIKSNRIAAIAFVSPFDEEKEKAKEVDQHWLSCLMGSYDDAGELTASMGVIPYNIRFDGHTVKMAGIGGVASLPETRQKGNIRAIFEYAFGEMRKEGVLFSALYPFSHDYYRMYGYELCITYNSYKIPLDMLKGFPSPYEVRMMDAGAAVVEFDAVRDTYIADKNMAILRTEREWKSILGGGIKDKRYAYLLKDEQGAPEAYVLLRAQDGEDKKTLNAADLGYLNYGALRRLLGFIYRLRAQYETLNISLPATEDIIGGLPEPWEIETGVEKNGMARVMDVEGVLRLMKLPCGEGAFTIEIYGDMVAENNGVFTVAYGADGRTVTKGAGAHDARMDIRTFSALVLGAVTLAQAGFREGLEVLGNAETLERVFVKKPVFMKDYF